MSTAVIEKALLHLSSADILGLNVAAKAFPITAGSGKLILPLWLISAYNYGTVGYNIAGDGNYPELRYEDVGDITVGPITGSAFAWLDGGTDDRTIAISLFTFGSNINGLDCVNKPVIVIQAPASHYVGGDGAVDLTLYYTIQDLS
jgi:hypothetical protein